jgi:hypothetical protein
VPGDTCYTHSDNTTDCCSGTVCPISSGGSNCCAPNSFCGPGGSCCSGPWCQGGTTCCESFGYVCGTGDGGTGDVCVPKP